MSKDMPDALNFAIVGAGAIARQHVKAILNHPAAKLVAVSSRDLTHIDDLLVDSSQVGKYLDYREMLLRSDIDVVCICTPSGTHSEIAIACAEAGKHVLCEKPLDIREDRMSAMIKTCRSHEVKLGCVFQRRLMPAAQHTQEALQAGKLGRLLIGNAFLKYYRSPEYYDSGSWRGTWELDGGGALMNQGIHGVDLLQHLMGDVDSVFAYSDTLFHRISVEDTSVVALKFRSGAFGVIQATTSVYPGQETRFELHGDKGTVEFGDEGFRQWAFRDHSEPVPFITDTLGLSVSSDPQQLSFAGHYYYIDDMIQAIHEGREPAVNGEEARKSVDLILACYESARTGKEVKLPV